MQEHIYIVEVESGISDQGNAMLFDSAWTTFKAAEAYCKERFKNVGWASQVPNYSIEKILLNVGG